MDEIRTNLDYPFDSDWIFENKRKIRRMLLEEGDHFTEKRIAVLGGSTTHDIVAVLELFLLHAGIKPTFYESEYNKYYEDAIFGNPELDAFQPDVIWIHTSSRNILKYPSLSASEEKISVMLASEFEHWQEIWEALTQRFGCMVIQNNFEQPFYRLLGNMDVSDIHGRLNYLNRLNELFYGYVRSHENFYINDINYMASCYGLQRWSDPSCWYRYKYALNISAIPELSYNVSLIIKAAFGKNKKAVVLDLDNTLWGGVVSEDGAEGIQIGQETAAAEMYMEFQEYIKAHKDLGILLAVNSKNDRDGALEGINHPDAALNETDFVCIKANWNSKDENMLEIAQDLNIGADSLVFIDDNPVERDIVRQNISEASVPEFSRPEDRIRILDRSGFFEALKLSDDDQKRTEMYLANSQRDIQQKKFSNYEDYLVSLEMEAEIKPFDSLHMARLAQLTNKSNQFNLTTLRCTQSELEKYAADPNYITLYGRLTDKFGDNGIITVVFGHIEEDILYLDQWLMSCRVLKRNMEHAMMDVILGICRERGIRHVMGYYYPTAKNQMVQNFYLEFGYSLLSEDESGNTVWQIDVEDYHNLNHVISVNGGEQ